MSKLLVIGATGFVGGLAVEQFRRDGHEVITAGRVSAPGVTHVTDSPGALQNAVTDDVDQIVVCTQLSLDVSAHIVELIDGPRWVVCSSAQLANATLAPGAEAALCRERTAVERGAVVLRPTMIYGHNRDGNVSVIIRRIARFGLALSIAEGRGLVQPLFVDDLIDAMACARARPISGCYEIGGSEATPVQELIADIAEVLGRSVLRIPVAAPVVRGAARVAPLLRLRSDQVLRLLEDKVVENAAIVHALGWTPQPHAARLERAVRQVVAASMPSMEAAA